MKTLWDWLPEFLVLIPLIIVIIIICNEPNGKKLHKDKNENSPHTI